MKNIHINSVETEVAGQIVNVFVDVKVVDQQSTYIAENLTFLVCPS